MMKPAQNALPLHCGQTCANAKNKTKRRQESCRNRNNVAGLAAGYTAGDQQSLDSRANLGHSLTVQEGLTRPADPLGCVPMTLVLHQSAKRSLSLF
jgi:hypothetical protein